MKTLINVFKIIGVLVVIFIIWFFVLGGNGVLHNALNFGGTTVNHTIGKATGGTVSVVGNASTASTLSGAGGF